MDARLSAKRDGGLWRVVVEDSRGERERARGLVNAGGPWSAM
ncbi:MAG: hypothetical protein R3C97_15890 [Geminicoccaceae bacterium]